MSSKFYDSIIDDERKVFGIKDETLKVAVKDVAKVYSRSALDTGSTYLDYNNPPNRCAYLYKYAAIHTAFVKKYFRKMVKKNGVKKVLQKKSSLKICCLGGGPGTDIVGIFKAISVIPSYQNKIVEVTVLDICGGWRNSFKRIISGLCEGEVDNVPATLVSHPNFKSQLIAVDLLKPLPANVAKILSEADIICMVKFISAIIGKPRALTALKEIGDKLKSDAVVLFIDNFQGNVSKPFEDIAKQTGLEVVLGPENERFPGNAKNGRKYFINHSKAKKELFGCIPSPGTTISVIGFKKSELCTQGSFEPDCSKFANYESDNESWATDSDDDIRQDVFQPIQQKQKTFCDAFAQTDETYLGQEAIGMHRVEDLYSLLESLNKLTNVLNEYQKDM